MSIEERLKNWKVYPTVKGQLVYELYKKMAENKDIYLITGDLGYKMFDAHQEDFPDRFINTGAAEQTMMGIAIGLALEGKIPFVYSITTFAVYRPFEWIRTYLNGENIPVKILGGGLGREYDEDGLTHQCEDLDKVLALFPKVKQLYPKTKEDVLPMLNILIEDKSPYFVGIPRK